MDNRPAQQAVAEDQVELLRLGNLEDVGTAKSYRCIKPLINTVRSLTPKDPFAGRIMGKATMGGGPGLQWF